VRKLFALSGNRCAFQSVDDGRGCEDELARPEWPLTRGEIAHICGESAGAARFDPAVDVRSFANLMILCPTHHQQVDYLEPEKYTVDVLVDMKRRHEERAGLGWAGEAELTHYAELVLRFQFGGGSESTRFGEPAVTVHPPEVRSPQTTPVELAAESNSQVTADLEARVAEPDGDEYSDEYSDLAPAVAPGDPAPYNRN
jgi:hypothetical protein